MEGVFVEEADSGEEVGVQADGGKRRNVGKGRFGGGLSSARGMSPVTRGRTEVTTCSLLRVTILLVFVLKTRLKRRVFNLFKPSEGKINILKMNILFFGIPFFSTVFFQGCGETISQVPHGCLPFGSGSYAGCEDDFEGHESGAFSGAGSAGRLETEFEGSLHDLPNSLVVVGPANALRHMGIAGACAEDNFDDHVVEFRNLLLAASAESGFVLHRLNSRNSFIGPSLARVFDGESGRVSRMFCRQGGGRGLWERDTARLDVLSHDVIRSVPTCFSPRIHGLPEYYDCSYAWESTSSNSRLVPEPWGGTKWSRRGSLRKVRQDVGKKLAFPQQLSGKLHVETWAGGCQSLNLEISQDQEIGRGCAVVGFPPRTPCVTPVLPGPGSDTRMKMEWKVQNKTRKSGVWFFQNAGVWLGSGVLRMLMGAVDWVRKGSYHTAWAVPCGSSCTCSYAYGQGPAVGPHTGERCWPLLAGVWRAIAPLMKPWCAEGRCRPPRT